MAHVSALQHIQFWMDSFHVSHQWSLTWEDTLWAMTFDLDLYPQGHSAMTLHKPAKIWHILLCPTLQHIQFWMDSFHFRHKWSLAWENVWCIMIFDLTFIFKVIQPWLCNKITKICHIQLCPLYSMYSSEWILSLFGTNDHQHERVHHVEWSLILTYIFKVIQSWICNKTVKIWHIFSCLLYSIYTSQLILSIFNTTDH